MMDHDEREFLLGVFLMEAWDTVGSLEKGLAPLGDPAVPWEEAAAPLLVLTHRLTGSAALHGFPALAALAATAESLLAVAPAGAERSRVVAALGEAAALSKEQFDLIGGTGGEDPARLAGFRARYASPEPGPAPADAGERADPLGRFFTDNADVLAYFVPEAAEHLEIMTTSLLALEREGPDEERLADVFRAAHTLKGAAYTVGCAPIGDAAHEIEDLLVALREGRLALTGAVIEAALAGADALRLVLQSDGRAPGDLGAALEQARADLRAVMLAALRPAAAPPGPEAGEGRAGVSAVHAAARARDARVHTLRERPPASAGSSIRIGLDRLDALMDLVGELMIAHSRFERRVAQLERVGGLLGVSRGRLGRAVRDIEVRSAEPRLTASRAGDDGGSGPPPGRAPLAELFAELEFDRYDDASLLARGLAEMAEDIGEAQAQHGLLVRAIHEDTAQIQRVTAALRKEVTGSRMVHVGRLFARVARQVREAARSAGKTVTLETQGESVHVDGSAVEPLADALTHLVQNAVAHAIEPEDDRRSRGKPAAGRIRLRAQQEGASVLVEVEDDGRGIDGEALKRHAVGQGFLPADAAAALSAPEALDLIFVPGFSTAATVSPAAGRGVGMDVVRTAVGRLNGEVLVSTEPGLGTRFTLKLPLTATIADAMMVRVAQQILAIPLTSVQVLRLVDPAVVQRATGGREVVPIDGELVDLIRLGPMLGLGAVAASPMPVAVLRTGGRPFAVAVDELLGKEEIVVKRLGEFLDGVGPYAGATISGEGRVVLVLDPSRLLAWSRPASRPRGELRAVPPTPAARPGTEPRRILLVDDSVSVRRFVGQMFEKAGFEVVTAVDGQDALERLTEITVDLVVTDLEMPRVHGYALIEDLRRRPATRHVPIVILTTRAGAKHRDLARRLGIRHYVTKPVDEESFVALIESIVGPVEPETALSAAGHP